MSANAIAAMKAVAFRAIGNLLVERQDGSADGSAQVKSGAGGTVVPVARGLHIEFDGTRSIHNEDGTVTTFLPPGMTMKDALHKLGATAREVEIPDKPRKLEEDAARFIAKYEREEPDSVLAVFRRYGSLDAEEFDSVERAERYLDGSEDEFLLAGEAVVTADGTITVWS